MNDDDGRALLGTCTLSLPPSSLRSSRRPRCGMRARRRSWERRAATAEARPPAFGSGDGTTNERGGESSTRRYYLRKIFRTRICHHKLVLLRVACRHSLATNFAMAKTFRWPASPNSSPPTRTQMSPVSPPSGRLGGDAYLVSCMARTILSQCQVVAQSPNTGITLPTKL